jgi:hypothetical protein
MRVQVRHVRPPDLHEPRPCCPALRPSVCYVYMFIKKKQSEMRRPGRQISRPELKGLDFSCFYRCGLYLLCIQMFIAGE